MPRSWSQRAMSSAQWAAGVPLSMTTQQDGTVRVHAGGYTIKATWNVERWEVAVGLHRYPLDRETTLAEQATECRIGARLLLTSWPDGHLGAQQEAARLHAIANLLDTLAMGFDPQPTQPETLGNTSWTPAEYQQQVRHLRAVRDGQ